MSINNGYIIANITLFGLPTLKLKIEADEGLVLTVANKKSQLIKEQFVAMAKKVKLDNNIVKLLKLRGFYVRGVFGADDAAATAISCAAATQLFAMVGGRFCSNPKRGQILISPDYNKARLELELNLVATVSVSMIIYSFLRILKNGRNKSNVKRT